MNVNLLIKTIQNESETFKTNFYNKTIKILENNDKSHLSVIFNESDYGDHMIYILEAYMQFMIMIIK